MPNLVSIATGGDSANSITESARVVSPILSSQNSPMLPSYDIATMQCWIC